MGLIPIVDVSEPVMSHKCLDILTHPLRLKVIPSFSNNSFCFCQLGTSLPWLSLTSQLSRIAESPQLLAIGECGLDKLTDTPIDIQITIFKQQIEIAENSKKPMIIHCVKAFNELIKLRKETAARQEWIIHGFRGKPQLATELIQHGFRISIGHKFNPETARIIPLYRLFLETDDSNIDIETVYRQIAEIRQIPENELIISIGTNFSELFDLSR